MTRRKGVTGNETGLMQVVMRFVLVLPQGNLSEVSARADWTMNWFSRIGILKPGVFRGQQAVVPLLLLKFAKHPQRETIVVRFTTVNR